MAGVVTYLYTVPLGVVDDVRQDPFHITHDHEDRQEDLKPVLSFLLVDRALQTY